MVDGVLVVDHRLRVRAANPAARELLAEQGLAPAGAVSVALASGLAAVVAGRRGGAGRSAHLARGRPRHRAGLRAGHRAPARAHALHAPARHRPAQAGEEFCVLLLEDVRTAEARLRQEKLAAMGRVSAGIAHEIRNPLAAIAQANALLLEDELGAGPAAAGAHGGRQRRAPQAHRRRRDGGGAGHAAAGARDRCHRRGGCRGRVGAAPSAAAGRRQPCCTSNCRRSPWAWLRPRAPAPRAGQPAGQRPPPRQRRCRARSSCAWRRDDALRAQLSWPATARRFRPRSSATCSSPSSRRAAAAPGSACTFAASCASATAPASNTGPVRAPRDCATNSV
jgi:hypothetical protein